MQQFLLTGILAAWSSMFLLNTPPRRIIFNWFCTGCFVLIASIEIITFLARGIFHPDTIVLFTLHAIPTGTLMILLSPGPVQLTFSESYRTKVLGYLVLLPGATLIVLTQKRGTILAIGIVAAFWACYRSAWRKYLGPAALLAAACLIIVKGPDLYRALDPDYPPHNSILQRLELYPYALHVWRQHPFLGLGLRSRTQEKYLAAYRQVNQNLDTFTPTVITLQTFDNMLVTSLVELGTLMTLLYLLLIIYIGRNYWRKLRTYQPYPRQEVYRSLVLLAVAIHSLSYDSLMFPAVNWLVHVNLGIMAAFAAAGPPNHNSLSLKKAA